MSSLPLLATQQGECWYDAAARQVIILDRRKLPRQIEYLRCSEPEQVARAIEVMAIQGAGALAMAAGYGVILGLELGQPLPEVIDRMRRTRPTGAALFGLLDELARRQSPSDMLDYLEGLYAERSRVAQETGRRAADLLHEGDTVLTHCFAGPALLWMLRRAWDSGKRVRTICTETRPYLQGARLTSFSIQQMGLPVTLITDSMAGHVLCSGQAQALVTAADRIAMDGSVANKVGTYLLACAAQRSKVPFYVLGYGGPDRSTDSGDRIPIEQRDPEEVLSFAGHRIAAERIPAMYFAFDVTPPELVTRLVFAGGAYSPAELAGAFQS